LLGDGLVAFSRYSLHGEPVQRVTVTEELPEKRCEVAARALSTSGRLLVPDEVIRTGNCRLVESAS
jgi:hypothetical protein